MLKRFSACFGLNDEMLELAANNVAPTFLHVALTSGKRSDEHFLPVIVQAILVCL